jgi:hypothetical protein
MENRTSTFYAVRVVRYYVDGRAPEVSWVQYDTSYGQGSRNWSLGSQEQAKRFKSLTRAKAALGYACVRDALDTTLVRDHETAEKVMAKKGKGYYHTWRSYPRLKVRHEAEVVKITERVTYDGPEVLDARPKRSALEQIARQAEN